MATGRKDAGDGSCFRRPDGRWECRASFGMTHDGKRDRRSFYGWTLKDAKAKMRVAQDEAEALGLPKVDPKMTVAAYAQSWLDTHSPSLRRTTAQNYAGVIKRYIVPAIGHVSLAALSPGHIGHMTQKALERGLAPGTVKTIHQVLREMLNAAVDWQLVPRNVAKLVKPPRVPDTEIPIILPSDALRLLDALRTHKHEAAFLLMIGLGLRSGEVCGLHWKDIDTEQRLLTVNRVVERINGIGLVLDDPKTPKSRRTLPIPDIVFDALERHKQRQIDDGRFNPAGTVFLGASTAPYLEPKRLSYALPKVIEAAGLPKMSPHKLRHTYGTLSRLNGVSETTLMRAMGHTSTRMTNRYGAIVDGLLQDAAAGMNDLLKGGEK